ncbi:hypothetical protein [Marinobacter zhanjiangensis]|uniref:Uncharacterized protein n=1 Tax=Marinobacter zhanjiangensis TaxID=578215 RepID=A0ABQ3B5D2_9GAMM|nr:hypothetical protein [Marinobacter zhanjiangensis]GGY75444.1 hypothetical protein GCM10007071_23340 [Marinobacter zhanjiangensis]
MKTSMHLSGEVLRHKLAAECGTVTEAEKVADDLCNQTSLSRDQIRVIHPGDDHQGGSLEPEDKGIAHTAIRSHVWLGLAGAAGGLLLFIVLAAAGIPFVAQNLIWAGALFSVFGGVVGLLLGGVYTLRPDHTAYASRSSSALRKGYYMVTIHARDRDQLGEAKSYLKARHIHTVRSL